MRVKTHSIFLQWMYGFKKSHLQYFQIFYQFLLHCTKFVLRIPSVKPFQMNVLWYEYELHWWICSLGFSQLDDIKSNENISRLSLMVTLAVLGYCTPWKKCGGGGMGVLDASLCSSLGPIATKFGTPPKRLSCNYFPKWDILLVVLIYAKFLCIKHTLLINSKIILFVSPEQSSGR